MPASTALFPTLATTCASLTGGFDTIVPARKAQLRALADYLVHRYRAGQTPQLIVICTHNSRRSHMGQVWLAAGAAYYGLPPLRSYSGGTEATAFNPRAVAALRRLGFAITTADEHAANPRYDVRWGSESAADTAFSKVYSESPNPRDGFAALLVCDSAAEACPVVTGADRRLLLPYEDPKAFDGTLREAAMYEERARQIGREMLYVLRHVADELATAHV